MRRVRDEERQPVSLGLGLGELGLAPLQILLHLLERLELLRRRLSLQLRPRAELVDLGDERAPALVGGEQRVERIGRALAGERGTVGVGLGARRFEIDHETESRTRKDEGRGKPRPYPPDT